MFSTAKASKGNSQKICSPNLTVQFILSLSTLMRTVPCLDDEREGGEGGKWVKVVCKRRGEEGRRGVWLNFGKREAAAACIRRSPDMGTMAHKAGNKERGEGRVGSDGDETRKIIITEKNRTPRRRQTRRTGRIKNMKIRGRTPGSDTEGGNL